MDKSIYSHISGLFTAVDKATTSKVDDVVALGNIIDKDERNMKLRGVFHMEASVKRRIIALDRILSNYAND